MLSPTLDTPTAQRDTRGLPLIVDLDGTLTPTDTLVEAMVQLVKQRPLSLLRVPGWLLKGRSHLKARVAAATSFNAATLPIRPELLAWLREQQVQRRRLVLATAAHESIARPVAERLQLFDQVLATTDQRNLKGAAKLRAVQEEIGRDFVYAGDSRADLPIWREAKAAVLVGASSAVKAEVRRTTPVEREFGGPAPGLRLWLKALRVHQWAKNLLLFVPVLTGFAFTNMASLGTVLLAFIAFSLAASATYIVNDLWDLDNDRAHPRKRNRPFASAQLSIFSGLGAAAGLLGLALLLASAVSPGFLAMLGLYIVMTSAYSWVLKRYVLVDVLMLALLYTLRVFAGSVAAHIPVSSWLLAFSVFLFFSLALVKRCSELVSLQQNGGAAARGRDYRVGDLTALWPLGVGSSLSAVVVFGMFINAPETRARYATPELMWLAALGLLYWVARLWIKTSRGEMHDDPIVFALKDIGSALSIAAMLAAMLVAHFAQLSLY
jgi:4-hydroxybenzoate polyprenyltransferase/phosphoserine phosphatase